MSTTQPLRGFTTISYWAADLEAAKRWYTELLGIEPYFQRPGYCEFRIGQESLTCRSVMCLKIWWPVLSIFWREVRENRHPAFVSGNRLEDE